MLELLAGEGIRGHDMQGIALHRADERQATRRCCRRCIRRRSRPARDARPPPPPRSWRAPSGPSCCRSDSRSPASAGCGRRSPGTMLRKASKEVLPMQCRISRCRPMPGDSMKRAFPCIYILCSIHISRSPPHATAKDSAHRRRSPGRGLSPAGTAGWPLGASPKFLDRELAALDLTAAQIGLMAQSRRDTRRHAGQLGPAHGPGAIDPVAQSAHAREPRG